MPRDLDATLEVSWASLVAQVVKKKKTKSPPANVGDIRNVGSIPGQEDLAWTIPWTEEPGGLQSMGSQ